MARYNDICQHNTDCDFIPHKFKSSCWRMPDGVQLLAPEEDDLDFVHFKEDHHHDSHTLRRIGSKYAQLKANDTHVQTKNPKLMQLFDNTCISLNKHSGFDRLIDQIEELAEAKNGPRFCKRANCTVTTYQIPEMGDTFRFTDLIPNDTSGQSDTVHERMIQINGATYSNTQLYYPNNIGYAKLKVPKNWNPDVQMNLLDSDEHSYVSTKISHTANSIDTRYHHEIEISAVCLHPSKPIFEMIHSDAACVHDCEKPKHCIRVMTNKPGYITKFDLYYRSSQTGNKWIFHGSYCGSTHQFDSVKIPIEPVVIKELRIVPTQFENSWNKVKVLAIGKTDSVPVSTDTFIDYVVTIPASPRTKAFDSTYFKCDDVWSGKRGSRSERAFRKEKTQRNYMCRNYSDDA